MAVCFNECLVSSTAADYGLFLADEDPKKGVWLENGRTLEYYLLRNGVRCSPFLSRSLAR